MMSSPFTKTCRQLRELLPEYAEGKLSGAPAMAVARHLVQCHRCAEEVADLRTILATLHGVPAATLPEGLVTSVTQAVTQGAPSRVPLRPFWLRIAIPLTTTTGVLALLITFYTMKLGQERSAPMADRGEIKSAGTPMAQSQALSPAERQGRDSRHQGGDNIGEREEVKGSDLLTPPSSLKNDLTVTPEAGAKPQQSLDRFTESSGGTHQQQSDQLDAGIAAKEPEKTASPPQGGGMGYARTSPSGTTEAARGAGVAGAGGAAPVTRDTVTGPAGPPGPKAESATGRNHSAATRIPPPDRVGPRAPLGPGRSSPGSWASNGHVKGGVREEVQKPSASFKHAGGGRLGAAAEPPQMALLKADGKLAVALLLPSSRAEKTVITVDGREVWNGASSRTENVVLAAETKSPRLRILPVSIATDTSTHEYLLYVPAFSQLGKLQSGSATRRYKNTPLPKVLEDMSARGGFILFVEDPPETKVTADISLESPLAAVETLAKFAGYSVHTKDYIIYILTQRKND